MANKWLGCTLWVALHFFTTSCNLEPADDTNPPFRPVVVAPAAAEALFLGDSYTKGEGVATTLSFPAQLILSLRQRGKSFAEPIVIARTGWRTDQLDAALASAGDVNSKTFRFVTLCIGVNNQFQNRPLDVYQAEFEALLQKAIARAGGTAQRVIVLSIPDWAFTPFGQRFSGGPASISTRIDAFNAANRAISQRLGVQYVDVTGISRRGIAEPDLVATDELHPSGRQYAEWVQQLAPLIE